MDGKKLMTTAYLWPAQVRAVQEMKKKTGMSMAVIIRKALDLYIARWRASSRRPR